MQYEQQLSQTGFRCCARTLYEGNSVMCESENISVSRRKLTLESSETGEMHISTPEILFTQ